MRKIDRIELDMSNGKHDPFWGRLAKFHEAFKVSMAVADAEELVETPVRGVVETVIRDNVSEEINLATYY